MRFLIPLVLVFLSLHLNASIPADNIGEGTCVGWVPVPADTVTDTTFHEGETLRLPDGQEIIKPPRSERTEAVIPSVTTVVRIIAGDGFAHGKVEQVFANPYDLPFEATYVFPLPHRGAVHAMEFRTSYGVYHASLMKKEDAEKKYEEAKLQGVQASLLTQTQDNIFTQKLCNIPPHDSVRVCITFSMALPYNAGTYELAFPTVVGPRYTPASHTPGSPNPDYLPPETRSGSTLDFTIVLITPFEIDHLTCASHEIAVEGGDMATAPEMPELMETGELLPPGVNPTLVKLAARETIPNKDIVVRFGRKNSERDISLVSWHDGEKGYFAMNIFPDLLDTTTANNSKAIDMIFVIDISGSMSGEPIKKVKEIMHAMVNRARPVDRLSFMAFNSSVSNCFSEPVQATPENCTIARKWIDGLQTGGGTEMLQGVKSGLAISIDPDRIRIMTLLTDGFISNIDQIYAEIVNDPNGTIPFTFGVGSSVNRVLIDGAAAAGNGVARELLLNDFVEPIVDEFWSQIRTPQLSSLHIDWGGNANNLLPEKVPNLWLGQPVTIMGCYREGGVRTITLSGEKDGKLVSEQYTAVFVNNNRFIDFVPKMWARRKISALYSNQAAAGDEHNKDSILHVSLQYDVLCRYTAFLALADSVVNEYGEMIEANIEVPVPEGVDPYLSGAVSLPMTSRIMISTVDTSMPNKGMDVKRILPEIKKPQVVSITLRNGILNMVVKNVTVGTPVTIDVYDMAGRRIGRWDFTGTSSVVLWNWNFRQSHISNGVYTFMIRTDRMFVRTAVLR